MARHRRAHWASNWPIALLVIVASAIGLWRSAPQGVHLSPARAAEPLVSAPLEPVSAKLVRVVDGDTLVIDAGAELGGDGVRVRLQCIDTEEAHENAQLSDTKPKTDLGVFAWGWAAGRLAPLPGEEGPTPLELTFDPGTARTDVYGRLLAYVSARGESLNLRMVREGLSPYFNKYGNSVLQHPEFLAAQDSARKGKRGIWSASGGDKERPYDKLLPWWNERAAAIDLFRQYDAAHPGRVLDVSRDLDEIIRRCQAGEHLTVFAAISSVRSLSAGNLAIELGAPRERSFILFVPARARDELDAVPLSRYSGELCQNYVYISGVGTTYRDLFEIEFSERTQISETPPAA